MPEGLERNSLSVQMDLYSTFAGGKVVFKLYKKGNIIGVKKYTVTSDEQPSIQSVQLETSESGYPRYKVVRINNITDIVELRKMEPVFYMTDDPVVWKKLGVK